MEAERFCAMDEGDDRNAHMMRSRRDKRVHRIERADHSI